MSAEYRGLLAECIALRDVFKGAKLLSMSERHRKLYLAQLLVLGHQLLKTLFTYRIVSDEGLAKLRAAMENLLAINEEDVAALHAAHRILFWFSKHAVQRLSMPAGTPTS